MADLHFLRPLWLLALPAAALLWWLVSRRTDPRQQWRAIIAPHLLDHLVVDHRGGSRLRPVHLTVALIAVGGIAAAGPSWERERPPFFEDKAPLAIALDLSATMDAIDIAPTRLERAKLKVHDLLALRAGARTAVFAYAGSAHLVLPLTDDAALLETYADSLSTALMPMPGKDTAKALALIDAALAREEVPGTILFLTDGVEPDGAAALQQYGGKHEIMVLGIGTAAGGPVKTGADTFLADATGRRVFAKVDVDALMKLKRSGVHVATVTLDDADVRWIEQRVQTHLQQQESDALARWKDTGWWLTPALALLGALWFRKGWTINWTAAAVWIALAGSVQGQSAKSEAPHDKRQSSDSLELEIRSWMLRAFVTPDQAGRLAYDRGDYAGAAERFTDPMWQGTAFYRAGRYGDAITAFARADTPESWFNQGDALAQLGKYAQAVASYEEALKRRPKWPQAERNLELVRTLVPPDDDKDDEAQDPNQKPDEVQFDDKGKKGKPGEVQLGMQTAEMWMRNIQTTPAQLLQRKFAIEAHGVKP